MVGPAKEMGDSAAVFYHRETLSKARHRVRALWPMQPPFL
jgi:hypothetical protein